MKDVKWFAFRASIYIHLKLQPFNLSWLLKTLTATTDFRWSYLQPYKLQVFQTPPKVITQNKKREMKESWNET